MVANRSGNERAQGQPTIVITPTGDRCLALVKTPGRYCSGSDDALPAKLCALVFNDEVPPIESFDFTIDLDPVIGDGFDNVVEDCPRILNFYNGSMPLNNVTYCTKSYYDAGYLNACENHTDCGTPPPSKQECLCECQACGRAGDACTEFVDPSNNASCLALFSKCNIPAPLAPPTDEPVSPPTEPPVSAPMSAPVSTPVAAPGTLPVAAPVSPPVQPPTAKSPTSPPMTPKASSGVELTPPLLAVLLSVLVLLAAL